MENKKNDVNVNSDNGTSIVLDDKIDNNIFNNTLINIKNIVQKIIDENKKSLNFSGNDKLLKTNKGNIIKGTENNINKSNNNFYSNVHIKTITNINEVISNNMNNMNGMMNPMMMNNMNQMIKLINQMIVLIYMKILTKIVKYKKIYYIINLFKIITIKTKKRKYS